MDRNNLAERTKIRPLQPEMTKTAPPQTKARWPAGRARKAIAGAAALKMAHRPPIPGAAAAASQADALPAVHPQQPGAQLATLGSAFNRATDHHDGTAGVVDAMLANRPEQGFDEAAMSPAANNQQLSAR